MEFKLVKWNYEFINDLAYHGNNMNIASNFVEPFPHPYSQEDAVDYIDKMIAADPDTCLAYAITIDHEAIGCVEIRGEEGKNNLQFFLAEEFWNKGIMKAVIAQICKEWFAQQEGSIVAEVFAYNITARRVLERNKFVNKEVLKDKIHRNGQMFDLCVYELIK